MIIIWIFWYESLYRQTFLVSKVIDNLQDEANEEYVQSGKKTNIIIANTDYDWEDPEGKKYFLFRIFFFYFFLIICLLQFLLPSQCYVFCVFSDLPTNMIFSLNSFLFFYVIVIILFHFCYYFSPWHFFCSDFFISCSVFVF